MENGLTDGIAEVTNAGPSDALPCSEKVSIDISENEIIMIPNSHSGMICSIIKDLDIEHFASAGWDGCVNIWNKLDGKLVRSIKCHTA